MDVVSKDDVLSQGEDPGMSDGEGLVSDSSIGIGQDPERRRVATVYDAVAGKLSNKKQKVEDGELPGSTHVKHPTKEYPYAPDEVLFRRKDAPQRYAEYDIYFSHERDLPRGGRGLLPESDLLKAIHSYSSHFYAASQHQGRSSITGRSVDTRSMDETALLAFGILLEEAGREALGRRGDLVFTEGAESSDDTSQDLAPDEVTGVMDDSQEVASQLPLHKRRRVERSKSPGPLPAEMDEEG